MPSHQAQDLSLTQHHRLLFLLSRCVGAVAAAAADRRGRGEGAASPSRRRSATQGRVACDDASHVCPERKVGAWDTGFFSVFFSEKMSLCRSGCVSGVYLLPSQKHIDTRVSAPLTLCIYHLGFFHVCPLTTRAPVAVRRTPGGFSRVLSPICNKDICCRTLDRSILIEGRLVRQTRFELRC